MGKWKLNPSCFTILFLVVGCAISPQPVLSTDQSTAVSFTAIPSLTSVPLSVLVDHSPQPTSTQPAGQFVPYFAATIADNVNLRTKPGTLFPVSRLLANGTRLKVLGHTPGGDWLYVQTDELVFGWVLVNLLDKGQHGRLNPIIEPQNVQLVRGQVLDLLGVPINGVGFAISQGVGPKAQRSDATTDINGQFYSYLPLSAAGQWSVSYISVSCSSNTMDASCNCLGGRCRQAEPEGVVISLPYMGVLNFVWK